MVGAGTVLGFANPIRYGENRGIYVHSIDIEPSNVEILVVFRHERVDMFMGSECS